MTKKFRTILTLTFLTLLIAAADPLFGADTSKWVVGAERFKYNSPAAAEDPSVSKGISEMFPSRILETLNDELVHIVYPDEKRDQALYDLRKTRLSLFLQLSAEYKKRDSLVLQNYSKRKLASKIKEEEKAIKTIQEKISANLKEVDQVMQKSIREEKMVQRGFFNMDESASEGENFKSMFRNIFDRDAEFVSSQNISFYKDDRTAFFEPSETAQKYGYSSYDYEKEVVNAGIKSLITGSITNYGSYYFVSADIYEFPGGKLNHSVSEVGLIEEADMISTSIAHQIVIALTNGMPVDIEISFNPAEIRDKVRIYLDDDLQPPKLSLIRSQSGVHSVRFVSDGYREMGTSYFFEGNKKYKIEVTMQEEHEVFIDAVNLCPFPGRFYAAGALAEAAKDQSLPPEGGLPPESETSAQEELFSRAKIRINDTQILGQFISNDGFTTNYYIPENLLNNKNLVSIKSKNIDINDYIDKRRRIMYGSYTLLMLSMVPYFYTYGNYANAATQYNNGIGSYEDALTWETRNQICGAISIGCGALFIYELVRYFLAVNDVLPQRAKAISEQKLEKQKQKELKKLEKMRKTEVVTEDESQENKDEIIDEEKVEGEEEK